MEARLTLGPLRIAGRLVTVETNSVDFAANVEWSFGDLLARAEDVGEPLSAIRFEVIESNRATHQWGIWRDGEPCEITLDEGYVLFQLQWEFNQIVLEERQTTLHAAAVEIDGHCVILSGSSMSGKTTLAGWLAAEGAGYVADEIVALNSDSEALHYRRPLGLRHGGPLDQQFTYPEHLAERFQSYEKLIPVSALRGRLMASEPLRVSAIIFPSYEPGQQTSLTPIAKSVALERLFANAPGLIRHGRPVFKQITELIRNVGTFHLVSTELPMVGELLRRLPDALDNHVG